MLCLLLCCSVVRTPLWYVSSCGKAPLKILLPALAMVLHPINSTDENESVK